MLEFYGHTWDIKLSAVSSEGKIFMSKVSLYNQGTAFCCSWYLEDNQISV